MMHWMGVNLLAVLAAGVACMVIGFLWYSPMLFARPWTIAMGMDPDDKQKMAELQKGAPMLYTVAFIASLLAAFLLGKILYRVDIYELPGILKYAVAVWAGFVATTQLTGVLFSHKPLKVFFIDTGYQLLCYLATGVILALWR